MRFKEVKSRSLVIKKGQTTGRFKLCKWFNASLHDRDNVRKLEQQVDDDLKKIAWEVQSMVLNILYSFVITAADVVACGGHK